MSSTNKTPKLGLNQWVLTDPFLMEDVNGDNAKIDAAVVRIEGELGKLINVKLQDMTLTGKNTEVIFDFSGIDLTNFIEVQIYFPYASPTYFTVNGYNGNIHRYSPNGWDAGDFPRYINMGKVCLRNANGLKSTEGMLYIQGSDYYYYNASAVGPLRKLTLENSPGFPVGSRFVAIGVRA